MYKLALDAHQRTRNIGCALNVHCIFEPATWWKSSLICKWTVNGLPPLAVAGLWSVCLNKNQSSSQTL